MKKREFWHSVAHQDREIFGLLVGRRFFRYLLVVLLFLILHGVLPLVWKGDDRWEVILHRVLLVVVVAAATAACNAVLLVISDAFKHSAKHGNRSIKGVIQVGQVVLFCVGLILVIAVLIDKSPKVLLAGLGASTAVLMLVFRDAIVGFVAGVQLTINDMVRIGDWVTLRDGSADGIVFEMTINTVKIRNWDNTIATVPPAALINDVFVNWRGMQEGGGRRVNKRILLDLSSLHFLSPLEVEALKPLVASAPTGTLTNAQLYRYYIETYLRGHSLVNADMDLIVSQKEPTAYGPPIQVYFFVRDKNWAEYERIQSDIFDHLLTIAPEFGVRLYQAE